MKCQTASRGLLASVLALVSGCGEPDPRLLFIRAMASLERETVYEYAFEMRRTDPSGAELGGLSGRATIERLDLSGSAYRARVSATRLAGRSGEPRARVEVARAAEEVYSLDEAASVVLFSSIYAAGPTLLASAQEALMYPFFDPRSLSGEAEAAGVDYLGRREIAGTRCDSLRVTYEDDPDDSRWCFDDAGYPRLMEWISADGSTTLEVTELVTRDSVADALFRLDVPEGFALREATVGPPLGEPVDDWTLSSPSGEAISLSDLRGRVVVLDFWATWCPPCLESLPALERLQRELVGRPVSLFAVNTMETGDPAELVERLGLTVPVLLDGDDLHTVYARGNLPAVIVIDSSGRYAGFGLGYFGEGSELHLRRLVERELALLNGASSGTRAP